MTFPLMDRTRRLTEEALEEAKLSWKDLGGVLLVGGSTRMPMVRTYVTQMAGSPPRSGVNVDEVVALGAAIQAAMEEGIETRDATPSFRLAGARRVHDVMSHSLGVVAVNTEGNSYVNDIVIRRNLPIPAENTKSYLHATHGGANAKLEVYMTQGESATPLDCSVLGKYVFTGIQATDSEGHGRYRGCRTTRMGSFRSTPPSATRVTRSRWRSSRSPTTCPGLAVPSQPPGSEAPSHRGFIC